MRISGCGRGLQAEILGCETEVVEDSSPVNNVIPLLFVFLCCRLEWCRLTDTVCGTLAAILRTSQSLTELKLPDNILGDAGVRLLCEGLKHPNCKLKTLDLWKCRLTDAACGDLAAVLRTSQSLTELNLSGNKLGDAGVKLLCEGLKHPNCKLERLFLESCGLTAACCRDLSSVLSIKPTLTELNLEGNNPGDSGLRLLCEGLKHPACNLQKLRLWYCHLTADGCRDLSSALRTNQSLIELDLGHNKLRDPGVQLLCEGLTHPKCKLHKIRCCELAGACCGDLSSVLRANPFLTDLELSDNELGDTGAQLLCEGLKHPNCKLQRLRLRICSLTAACCGNLSSVLSTSQTLTEMELWGNELGDSGVQLLCEGLKHPDCKLQKLWLSDCDLTAICCEDLSSALTINQTLTELDLGENKLRDSGVQLLCEGLKYPNCKLQKLG
uniref:Uncharacterized protein n=1 Tax=Gopherus agassizii TaxID=38772 RepID=A0A452IFH5_9SAUR